MYQLFKDGMWKTTILLFLIWVLVVGYYFGIVLITTVIFQYDKHCSMFSVTTGVLLYSTCVLCDCKVYVSHVTVQYICAMCLYSACECTVRTLLICDCTVHLSYVTVQYMHAMCLYSTCVCTVHVTVQYVHYSYAHVTVCAILSVLQLYRE